MRKPFLIALCVVLLCLFSALVSLLVQPQWYRDLIERGVEQSTGYQLRIGSISTHLKPLRLEIQGVNLQNPYWPSPQLLRIDEIALAVTGNPLSGANFWQLHTSGIDLRVEQDSSGVSNWQTSVPKAETAKAEKPEPASEPGTFPADFSFAQIAVNNLQVQITQDDKTTQLTLPTLTLQRDQPGNAQLQLELQIADQSFIAEGSATLPSQASAPLKLALSLKHPKIQLQSSVALTAQPALRGSRASLSMSADDLTPIAAITGIAMPDFKALRAATELDISDDFHFSNTRLAIGDNALNGEGRLNPDQHSADIELHSAHLDIDSLLAALPASSGENSAPATDQNTEETALDWQWLQTLDTELELSLDSLNFQQWQLESVHSAVKLKRQIQLNLDIERATNTSTDTDLRQLAWVTQLEPLAQQTLGADMRVQSSLALADHAQAEAKGDINLNAADGTQFQVQLAAAHSLPLWQSLGLPYSEAGAVQVVARVDSAKAGINGHLNASLGKQQLTAAAEWQAGERNQLQLAVNGDDLDLRFMQPQAAQEPVTAAEPPADAEDSDKIFSNEPLDFSALQSIDADVQLAIHNLNTAYNQIEEIQLAPRLKAGRLSLDNGRIALADNKLAVNLDLDTRGKQPKLSLNTRLDSSDFGALGLTSATGIKGGEGQFSLALKTYGSSSRELAGNLQGNLALLAQGLVADNGSLDLLGSDLITETLGKLNPFSKTDPNTHFECIAVNYDGNNGVFRSDKDMVIETRKLKIVGTGDIDFGNETLELSFTPIARKGLGVNLTGLAKLVRIGGSLKHPSPEFDAGGALSTTLSTGAAVYTGGLSILAQSMIQRAVNSGSPCHPDAPPVEYEIPLPPAPPATAANPEQPPGSSAPASTPEPQQPPTAP